MFNDVTPNEEDESTSKLKQPVQICHSLSPEYRRAKVDRVCSEAKTVSCLSWPLEGTRENKLNIL